MSLNGIRQAYNVPAFRGTRVRYLGSSNPVEGVILSARQAQLRIACDDGLRLTLHPDYQVQYLNEAGLVVDDRTDVIPDRKPDGEFRSYSVWVNKARSWIGGTRAACFDSKSRRCRIGSDFMRADAEDAFPVRFWLPEAFR